MVVYNFKYIMDLFYKETWMKLNLEKSTLSQWGIPERYMVYFSQILPFKLIYLLVLEVDSWLLKIQS